MGPNDTKARLEALRQLLTRAEVNTQDELRQELEDRDFVVTQSTISRDLRRIGAIRAVDAKGRTIYRLPVDQSASPVLKPTLKNMIVDIRTNGVLIVIHTTPGSASLVARVLDQTRPAGILGTVAGDDTIFVAPESLKKVRATIKEIETSFSAQ